MTSFISPISAGMPLSRVVFNKHDKNQDGCLDADEFKTMCYEMGHCVTEEEAILAVARIDADGNGTIDYDEFLVWWKKDDRFDWLSLNEKQQETLLGAIQFFVASDSDQSGLLDRSEFEGVYNELIDFGLKLGSFEDCLASLDKDGSGNASLNEFSRWLVTVGALEELTEKV